METGKKRNEADNEIVRDNFIALFLLPTVKSESFSSHRETKFYSS